MLKPEDLLPSPRVYEILNSHGVSVSNSVVTAGAVHQILSEAAEKFEEALQKRLEALLPGMTPHVFRVSVEVNLDQVPPPDLLYGTQDARAASRLAEILMKTIPVKKVKPELGNGRNREGLKHPPVDEIWVWEGVIFTAKPEVENVPS